MTDIADIEPAWLTHHPLPVHDAGTDKNFRGRVLLVGGAEFVPGARCSAENRIECRSDNPGYPELRGID